MEEILKGKTESGFEYKIPKKRLRNFYLMREASTQIIHTSLN